MGVLEMKNMLKKGAAALYIRNNIKNYFNQPSEFEAKILLKKRATENFEKKKIEAL